MVTYLPIASPFVRLSGFWVDDALSFAMGWNYFFLMGPLHPFFPGVCCFFRTYFRLTWLHVSAFSIPYEITAIDVLLTYWTDKIPIAVVVIVCLIIYAYDFPTCYFRKKNKSDL
jgi:amino acid transporter